MRRVLALVGLLIVSNASAASAASVASSREGPEPAPSKDVGSLSVSSDPPARVSVDGKDTGKTTPVEKIDLPVGHHQLTLVSVADPKLTRSLGFNVTKGETTRLKVNFAP